MNYAQQSEFGKNQISTTTGNNGITDFRSTSLID